MLEGVMNSQIFREYDIRGRVNEDLTPDVVKNIGRGYATMMIKEKGVSSPRIALGRDCRLSSDRLRDNLIEGLVESGCSIIDIGVCPTPVLYFALFNLDVDGGLMITGSHNPPEFNGLKVCIGKETIYGPLIRHLGEIMEGEDFVKGNGNVEISPITDQYTTYLKENIHIVRPIRVVVDAGNGTGGVIAAPVMEHLGCQVTCLYCDMDGRFPNHHPDPTIPENMKALIEHVNSTGSELGIGYDGDADRIGVIDDKGTIIWGDQLMILFSRAILSEHPSATIVSEVKCSMNLFEDIEKHGGKGIMWKAGHSLIKKKMRDEKALLGGEMSGHIFFADRYFGYDDAIYASLRLMEMLAKGNRSISEMLADVPKTFSTPEIRIECPDEKKFDVVTSVHNYFVENGYNVIDVDGVRVIFEDGWGLARPSNTQPVIVLRFEAKTEERLNEIRELIVNKLKEYL